MLIDPLDLAKIAGEISVLEVYTDRSGSSSVAADDFLKGHIPNAQLLNLWDLANKDADFDFTVLSSDEFSEVVRAKGVCGGKPVVVYQRGDAVERQAGIGVYASRLWWLLTFYGHKNVSVLHGGFKAWKDAGCGIETGIDESTKESGDFQASPQNSLSIPFQKVQELMAGKDESLTLCDARAADVYEQKNIAKAVNITIGDISEASGDKLKKPEDLKEVFLKVLEHDGKVSAPVTFCNSGMSASLLAFAANEAGFQPRMWQCGYNEYLFKTK